MGRFDPSAAQSCGSKCVRRRYQYHSSDPTIAPIAVMVIYPTAVSTSVMTGFRGVWVKWIGMPYKFVLENNGRDELVSRIQEITGENTKAGAIDVALAHYVQDHRQKERIADELDREVLEKLSTSELPLRRGETEVGPFKD